jgi:hypothetical protein
MYNQKNPHYKRKFLIFEFLGATIIFCSLAGIGVAGQPSYSAVVPSEVKSLPAAGHQTTEQGNKIMNVQSDGLVMYSLSSNPVKVRFWLGDVVPEAVVGFWYGANASVAISVDGKTSVISGLPYYDSRMWGTHITLPTRASNELPCFTVDWPVTSESSHKTIQISAKMMLYYPQLLYGASDTYETHNKTSSVNFSLYVISPQEFEQKYLIENYSATGPAIGFTILWLIFGGPFFFAIYRKIDKNRAKNVYVRRF